LADSVIPLRFKMVMKIMNETAISTLKGNRTGKAEAMASAPDETLTATVKI